MERTDDRGVVIPAPLHFNNDERRWLLISKAIRILHRLLKTRLAGQEPAPWIVPPADPFDAESKNATHRHRRVARTSLTMRRALLSGDLTVHVMKDGRSHPLPGWVWENARAAEHAFYFHWLPLDRLLEHGFEEFGERYCFLSRADLRSWLSRSDIAEIGDLPTLPAPFDHDVRPEQVSYREPPDRPFVELTQALTWIAFAVSLSRDEFSQMEPCGFGPFAEGGWPDGLRAAMAVFADQASAGNIRVRGRYVASRSDLTAAAQANTVYLTDTQLRDFASFDSLYGGLERGSGLVREGNVLERALNGRRDGWRDVEVCRAELLNVFPPTAGGQRDAGGKVPANRQLNHDEIIGQAASMIAAQPGITIGSAAASIAQDLPVNPRTGKRRDTRHIEKMIAHLWEGGQSESPQ